MTDFSEIDRTILERLERSLDELRRLCAIPSVSAQGTGIQECAELVSELLSARGFQTNILPTSGNPVVYAKRPGRSQRRLLFYNHYDVQPAEPLDLWESPPFEATLRDGKVYARGANDDKGQIVARLAALDAVLAVEGELPCTVKFIIEGEEESSSTGLAGFVDSQTDLLAADGCIWEFGGVDHEGVPIQYAGLRGICYVELSVETAAIDAHSGTGGSIFENAAWRLTWALSSLKGPDEHIRLPGFYDKVRHPTARDLDLLAELPPEADYFKQTYGLRRFLKDMQDENEIRRESIFSPTCTICGLTAGYQGPGGKTVLPARASAKVDFRLVPDQRPSDVLAQLRQHLDGQGFSDVRITDLGGEIPARTDPDDPFLQLVAETARDVYGRPQRIIPMSGGSGPNYPFLHVLKVPVATAGVGYPGSRAHAPNEHLVLDHFLSGTRHLTRILTRFGEG
ncbi:MAG TPA: M20/M25/M40 family metallo-hydrolase [Anaerolineales bacterium]|nr:M20/M25/M40 family metallo-hydrolase [Anaerolineales bacterium]